MKLAPGGKVGRFIIWTESAFRKLDTIFGTHTQKSAVKKGFTLPRPKMTNPDIIRLMRSDEIVKSTVRKPETVAVSKTHGNPLKNVKLLEKLNPYAASRKTVHKV